MNLRALQSLLVPDRFSRLLSSVFLLSGLCIFLSAEALAIPRLAVAPLTTDDTEADLELLTELAQTIHQQLAERPAIELVSIEDVDQAMTDLADTPSSEEDYRSLAGDLGAAYILTGRLTELAGEFNLDVSLIPEDPLMGTPENLIFTATDREDLLASADGIAGSVASAVERAGSMIVTEVRFSGGVELTMEVVTELKTQAGEVLDPRNVYADVETLRGMEQVATAGAELERGTEGVVVIFELISQDVIQQSKEEIGGKNRIVEIRIEGNRRIEANAIRARMVTKLAQPFQADRLARDIQSIYRLGFFSDVRVFRELGTNGWIVTIEVEENPVVREVAITGNDGVKSEEIKDALTLTTGSVMDYSLLHEKTARIESL
jgi:hypothetical protein